MSNPTPHANWPVGVAIKNIRAGQSFIERVEELLGRTVGPDERIADITPELLKVSRADVVLVSIDSLDVFTCGQCDLAEC